MRRFLFSLFFCIIFFSCNYDGEIAICIEDPVVRMWNFQVTDEYNEEIILSVLPQFRYNKSGEFEIPEELVFNKTYSHNTKDSFEVSSVSPEDEIQSFIVTITCGQNQGPRIFSGWEKNSNAPGSENAEQYGIAWYDSDSATLNSNLLEEPIKCMISEIPVINVKINENGEVFFFLH